MPEKRSKSLNQGLVGRVAAAVFLSIGLLLAAPPTASFHAVAAENSPQEVVEQMNATLIDVMREAGALGYQGRLAKLTPVLNASFNYPLMARIAVSKHWKDLSPDKKETLSKLFAELSSATFAARFDGYNGESFKIVDQSDRPRDTVLVTNHLVKSDGEVVALNYLLRQSNDRWRIVDVYLDSKYSELAIKRSEFTSVISQNGVDALISEIRTRIAKIQKSAGG